MKCTRCGGFALTDICMECAMMDSLKSITGFKDNQAKEIVTRKEHNMKDSQQETIKKVVLRKNPPKIELDGNYYSNLELAITKLLFNLGALYVDELADYLNTTKGIVNAVVYGSKVIQFQEQ